MRHKLPSPSDPAEWLRRARSNLAIAKNQIPEACFEDLCFESHQAAEKAIKAVFVHIELAFPFIHDLVKLLDLLHRAGIKIPKYLTQAKYLNPFAVLTRYPNSTKSVTERDYKQAVKIAEKTVHWAQARIDKAP